MMPPSPSPPTSPSSHDVPDPSASPENRSNSESDPSVSPLIQPQPPDRLLPPPKPESEQNNTLALHSISFNQDFTCFAAATDHGFRIYNTAPFREIFRRTFPFSSPTDQAAARSGFSGGGGIGLVQMLFRCNILALVGGGDNPQYQPRKVMIWDDHQCRCIGELSFRSEVKAVRLRRDRIIVVLMQKLFVYNFADLKLLHQIETIANPKGLCEVSCSSNSIVLVCPGLQKGQIRVENYGSKRTKFIMAHDSRIAAIALTQDGRMVATASSKGTLIRVFNTLDGTLLQEVRRGTDRAEIYSITFSTNGQWLGATSDRGTIHVFSLKGESGPPQTKGQEVISEETHSPQSPTSPHTPVKSLSFMKGVLPKYFSSECSVAQFHLREGSHFIAFGHDDNTVVIAGMDGSFYRCKFDPASGGEMTQLENHNFLHEAEAPEC